MRGLVVPTTCHRLPSMRQPTLLIGMVFEFALLAIWYRPSNRRISYADIGVILAIIIPVETT